MDRRAFVRKGALGAAAGSIFTGCGGGEADRTAPSVQTGERIRWRLVSSFPRSLDTIYGAAEVMSQRLRVLTDDRFQIRVYPAGEIVPAFEVLGAVQNGTVQMGHSASYYFRGKHPALAFDCSVPFGLTARQQTAWLYDGGGLELFRELFAEFDVVNLPGGNTGAQMGGWFRQPVTSLGDLRGLKMRIPGLGGEVMSALGMTVQVIAGGEIYPALERGAIDAAEWVGPYDDEKLGLHQIARHYYYPGWWEPGPALTFYVNRREWEQLPTPYREALTTAAADANVRMLARYDALNPPALERLLQEDVELRTFPNDLMVEAQSVAADLLESAGSDGHYSRIYEAFREWKSATHRWFGTAEFSYSAFMYGR